ncbi:hypothetical protein [Paenibacillus thalictri]|nr:hypothetical protein [Paenibacillus thalictri]
MDRIRDFTGCLREKGVIHGDGVSQKGEVKTKMMEMAYEAGKQI